MDHKIEVLEVLGIWARRTKYNVVFRDYQLRYRISVDGIETTVDKDVKCRPITKDATFDGLFYITLKFGNPLIKKSKDYRVIRDQCLYMINKWKSEGRLLNADKLKYITK